MEEAEFADIKIYGYYPVSWLPLSFMQWKRRKESILKLNYPGWFNLICYLIGWASIKLGLAEKLIGIGVKRGK